MNVPASTRRTVILCASSARFVSWTTTPSSSSLSPPRLLTRSTTRSVPSFLKGTKLRSGSVVDVIILMSSEMSSLSGGVGQMRRFPLSLWIPSPISISSGRRLLFGSMDVPGTCVVHK